jgi:membrane-associated phospholipid phosphatase
LRKYDFLLPFLVVAFGLVLLQDAQIRTSLHDHPPSIEPVMSAATSAGNFFVLLSLTALLWAGGVFLNGTRLRDAGLWGAVALLISEGTAELIKHLVGRGRPFLTEVSPYDFLGPTFSNGYDSFPSAHAITGFALAFSLGEFYPKGRSIFYLFALLVSYSRVYLDAHFASDVFAGAVLGIWIGFLLTRRWVRT